MTKKKILILLPIVVLIGYFSYTKLIVPSKISSPIYQTQTAAKDTFIVSVSGSGNVTSTNSSPVTTSTSGVVSKVYYKDGDVIKAGALIATIDPDMDGKQKNAQAYASYLSAKNNLDSAKSNQLSLESSMWKANQTFIHNAGDPGLAATDPTYIQTNRDWLSAEDKYLAQAQAITGAQNSLNAAWITYQQASPNIYAPISGIVRGLSLQEGTVISSNNSSSSTNTSTKIANIVTSAAATINITLSEIDIPKVKVGDKAVVTFSSLSDRTFAGKVISVDTVGSVTSNVTSYPVVISLIENSNEILSNMSAEASIITTVKDNTIAVPLSSVTTQNGVSTVKVLVNKVPQTKTVEIGLSSDTAIEITSGLSEGDLVITSTTLPSSAATRSSSTSVFSPFGSTRSGGGAGNNIRINR